MRFLRVVTIAVTLAVAVSAGAQAPKPQAAHSKTKYTAAQVERGRYLVDSAGLCADCHTPRNERGQFVKEKWLQGSPLPFKPLVEIPNWMGAAPPIAGLDGWTDAEAVKFLTTGKTPDGGVANPPMPEYRFSRQDATAIVAYLKSLKATGAAPKTEAKKEKPDGTK